MLAAAVLSAVVPAAGIPAPELVAQTPPPFKLGPNPVPATGTFTNGRGGCPVATSFEATFLFFAPGDGKMKITEPKTGDEVVVTIDRNGNFDGRSARESYTDGKITGNTATAKYSYTTVSGCTETYDVTFVLELAESDLELSLTAPARATLKYRSERKKAVVDVRYRVVVTNGGASTSPAATVVLRLSRPLLVEAYGFGGRWGIPEKKIAACSGSRRGYEPTVLQTCRVPELHRGESAGIAILAMATRPGLYVMRGTVTGVNLDPVLANNRATRRTTVRR